MPAAHVQLTPALAPVAAAGPAVVPPPVLTVSQLVKEFPGTRALDGVDLAMLPGEIHALLGENGAGKSTLIKAICGVHAPTSGEIRLLGQPVAFASPQEAQAAGIAAVHQHANLVPSLTVAENLLLGERLPRRLGVLVNWRAVDRRASAVLQRVGLNISPRAIVSELRPDEVAMVAIARAIASDARIIVLDEPTAALLPQEVAVLFAQMRRLARDGHSFLYVSHRLTEVFEIADRVTVLRDGRVAGSWARAEMSRHAVVEAIVGRNPALLEDAAGSAPTVGAALLHAEALAGGRVAALSMTLHAGEIVGFAGLPGSGAEEALDLLYARVPRQGGTLTLDGRATTFASPRDAKRARVALLPRDRIAESLLPRHSVRENVSLPTLGRFTLDPLFRFVRRGRERAAMVQVTQRLNVRMPGIEAPIEALSGGNQQKAMLGRWVASDAKVYLLSSPTAAVDVGAKAEIYGLIRQIAGAGAGVIFTSTEVEEFPRVCHRVLVFRDGRIVGELVGPDATEQHIMQLAVGGDNEPQHHP